MAKKQAPGEKRISELEAQLAYSGAQLVDCQDRNTVLKAKLTKVRADSKAEDPLIATGLRLAQTNEVLRKEVASLRKESAAAVGSFRRDTEKI